MILAAFGGVIAERIRAEHTDMADARGVEIRVLDTLPTLTIDVGRLELAFVNLLSNAIKYSDEAKPVRWVEIGGCECADGWCQIAVRDNGLGIPSDSVAKIFERFTRAHAQRDAPSTSAAWAWGCQLSKTAWGNARSDRG